MLAKTSRIFICGGNKTFPRGGQNHPRIISGDPTSIQYSYGSIIVLESNTMSIFTVIITLLYPNTKNYTYKEITLKYSPKQLTLL